jgi:hypothetical protein
MERVTLQIPQERGVFLLIINSLPTEFVGELEDEGVIECRQTVIAGHGEPADEVIVTVSVALARL